MSTDDLDMDVLRAVAGCARSQALALPKRRHEAARIDPTFRAGFAWAWRKPTGIA
jgi:hypothetical protein